MKPVASCAHCPAWLYGRLDPSSVSPNTYSSFKVLFLVRYSVTVMGKTASADTSSSHLWSGKQWKPSELRQTRRNSAQKACQQPRNPFHTAANVMGGISGQWGLQGVPTPSSPYTLHNHHPKYLPPVLAQANRPSGAVAQQEDSVTLRIEG